MRDNVFKSEVARIAGTHPYLSTWETEEVDLCEVEASLLGVPGQPGLRSKALCKI